MLIGIGFGAAALVDFYLTPCDGNIFAYSRAVGSGKGAREYVLSQIWAVCTKFEI